MFYVYAIHNQLHDKIYIGQTNDLDQRIAQHNNHSLKGYTSRFDGSWVLVYNEEVTSRKIALVREKQLKSFQGRVFIRKLIT